MRSGAAALCTQLRSSGRHHAGSSWEWRRPRAGLDTSPKWPRIILELGKNQINQTKASACLYSHTDSKLYQVKNLQIDLPLKRRGTMVIYCYNSSCKPAILLSNLASCQPPAITTRTRPFQRWPQLLCNQEVVDRGRLGVVTSRVKLLGEELGQKLRQLPIVACVAALQILLSPLGSPACFNSGNEAHPLHKTGLASCPIQKIGQLLWTRQRTSAAKMSGIYLTDVCPEV